jgi:hypothetical protein
LGVEQSALGKILMNGIQFRAIFGTRAGLDFIYLRSRSEYISSGSELLGRIRSTRHEE